MNGHRTYRMLCGLFGAMLLLLTLPALAQQECSRTWTLDADFDDGTVINLGIDDDELVLNTFTTPLPFVYVAVSARGTVVRIDIDDGTILGEYYTSPAGMQRNPSRTTVDKFGNVWVANRDEAGWSNGEYKGSIMRIGVVIGGTRYRKNLDGTYTEDANGLYLKPPFLYSTVTDRDGDGYIKTSTGLGSILPWTNAGGVNTHGGVSTAEDEAIINYTRVAGSLTRTVAVDANNDVWTSGTGDNEHEKVSGVTGLPIAGTKFYTGCGGYGGLIGRGNVLWSARGPSGLLRYDTDSPIPGTAGSDYSCYGSTYGDYGLGIDPATGNIWHTNVSGNRVAVISPTGSLIAAYSHGYNDAQGVAVDASGNVWVAHSLIGSGATTVGHLRTNGTFVGNVTLPSGRGPTGVSVDANGKVWVTNYFTHNVQRIDPEGGAIGGGGYRIGAVDMTVSLGSNAYPYNYSDMTGFVSLGSSTPSGSWTVVHDGEVDDGPWGVLSWLGTTPEGTAIRVEIRAANTQLGLAGEEFVEVDNGVSFCSLDITGRYLEIRVTLSRSSGDGTPSLQSITLSCCNEPPVAVCTTLSVEADGTCMASVEASAIDNGSYDPDADEGSGVTLAMSPAGPFGLGEHQVTLTATDADGATDECVTTITVVDGSVPSITLIESAIEPWPANHGYTTVGITDFVTAVADNCDATLAISDVRISRVSSDELEDANGAGDGSTLNDIVIADDCRSVDLRVERDGNGDGRVYRIECELTDEAGNTCTAEYRVPIRRNNGSNGAAIAGDPVYWVDADCGGATKLVMPGVRSAEGFLLEQNIPNPFNPTTEIPFALGTPGRVTIGIYDQLGALVAIALDESRPAGRQSVELDASALPSGTYYYVLESSGVKLVRRMTLAK